MSSDITIEDKPTEQEVEPQERRLDLTAVFVTDDKLGTYRGARCELPTGDVIEVTNRRTPFYDLARALVEMDYGDWRLQVFTHTGTPSLRGKVSAMAKLTVKERDRGGLRLEPFQKFPGRPADGDLGPEAPQVPDNEEPRPSDSPAREEAA